MSWPCGRRKLRTAELQARFGLGNVGAGEIADLEAILCRLQVGLEHLDVVLVELDDRAVANDVHVGGDGLGEDVAFDGLKGRAAGLDAGFSGADGILDRPPVNKGTLRSTPAERVGPLPPLMSRPVCVIVRLRPTCALTCGRPAALAIATVASVACERLALGRQRRVVL